MTTLFAQLRKDLELMKSWVLMRKRARRHWMEDLMDSPASAKPMREVSTSPVRQKAGASRATTDSSAGTVMPTPGRHH